MKDIFLISALTAFFLILGGIAAEEAFGSSPLPDTKWEVKTDPAGWPVMMNNDKQTGTIFSFGYSNSKNCGDIRMMIGNIVPTSDGKYPEGNFEAPSTMMIPEIGEMPLGTVPITFYSIPDSTNVLMMYNYTPTDKLIMAIMNTEVFFWKDAAFKEDSWAGFNNTGFLEAFNQVTNSCFEKTKDQPKKEETKGSERA